MNLLNLLKNRNRKKKAVLSGPLRDIKLVRTVFNKKQKDAFKMSSNSYCCQYLGRVLYFTHRLITWELCSPLPKTTKTLADVRVYAKINEKVQSFDWGCRLSQRANMGSEAESQRTQQRIKVSLAFLPCSWGKKPMCVAEKEATL